jgi:CRISPR-associated protein Csb2
MSQSLLISVRLHEGWYHGSDGMPSPAKLFQAIVAGTGLSGPLDTDCLASLEWLEKQAPPFVASPHRALQKSYGNYVPNNDLDAKHGDPNRVNEIRVKKAITPVVFDHSVPFLYGWTLANDAAVAAAQNLLPLVDRLYQLGRGIDMAWAWAELVPDNELQARLQVYPGVIRRASGVSGTVDCPTPGSLASLQLRHRASAHQFASTLDGRGQTFRQRPKPKWRKVSYSGTPQRYMLELTQSDGSGFASWPLEGATQLVEEVRDAAAEKLRLAFPNQVSEVDQVLIGRKPDGTNAGPTPSRVRIIPLPSIGHPEADMQIRRLLVDVPGECLLRADDIGWAFSGLRLVHPPSGNQIDLTRSADQSTLRHFGVDHPARIWRSITPVALSAAKRRRIDPLRVRDDQQEKKSGQEKHAEHALAFDALPNALRHADLNVRVHAVRVQREPFDQRGQRVEAFARGTRFDKHTLWHMELEFDSLVAGPVVLGDGRFLGLGLMRPATTPSGVHSFDIKTGLRANPEPMRVATALRRAVMARTQVVLVNQCLPSYFSGHADDGTHGRAERPHLAFICDPLRRQMFVVTPSRLNRKTDFSDRQHAETLERALRGLGELRAGPDGNLIVQRTVIDTETHHLFQPATTWESLTPYLVNRHSRKSTAESVLTRDILAECERVDLPRPVVHILKYSASPKAGLQGWLRLEFRDPVEGMIILGRSRYTGGGVFASACKPTQSNSEER